MRTARPQSVVRPHPVVRSLFVTRHLLVVLCLLSSLLPGLAAPSEQCVTVSVASVFREPSATAERVTQALLGEHVRVLSVSGGWARVIVTGQYRMADGYPGYILSNALAPPPTDGPETARVKVARTAVRTEANATAPAVRTAFMGTLLAADPRESDAAWVRVYLPGREQPAYVAAADVALEPVAMKTGADVIRTALQLKGTLYLWGGLTASGIDCSGLTFESFRVHGITLPRDADQQFQVGRSVDRDHLQAGDLVFFGSRPGRVTHVGIYWKEGLFVESAGRLGVSVSALDGRTGFRGGRRVIGTTLRMPAPSY